ncbi:MAG: UDP-N-acetylmuramate dehydrogenase [Tannerella sp.]|jgi:UDP-N-acetylmuramate dehydrogenase|nr:UDP-N-acetylmuramate dehydrogenase [Tannerella sp.]
MIIEENHSLENLNTFHLVAKARWYVEYASETELENFLKDDRFRNLPVVALGCGSNMLFLSDFDGVVVRSAIKGITIVAESDQSLLLRVGAAEIWDDVVAYAVGKGFGGIENLSAIPGQTGAAAVQNIGAYGVEIKDVVDSIEAMNRLTCEKRIFSNAECLFDYRSSIFKDTSPYIVMYVNLRLQKKPDFHLGYGNLKDYFRSDHSLTLQNIRETIVGIRKNKLPDPNVLGNAGSFFMNPVVTNEKLEQIQKKYPSIPFFPAQNGFFKLSAGWMIEQCGLKGKRFGRCGIYEHQALVIVNYGGATGSEIAQLASDICQTVYQRFDVELMPEVKYVV